MARFDHLKACRKLAEFSTSSAEDIFKVFFSGDRAPAKLHEVGKLSSEEFFLVARKVANLDEGLSFQEFCTIWKNIFEENRGLEAVLNLIRPEVKQCILSNTEPIHWSAIEQLPVMKKFFGDSQLLVRSYTAGTRKPDPRMYQDALRCLGIAEKDVQHVLYIDDIAEYRDAFERMGGNVLPYDCSKDAIMHLEAGLRKFGVLQV